MTPNEERELIVRWRFPKEAETMFGPPGWRTHSILVQLVFFILTAIGIGALYGFLNLLNISGEGIITGILAIALAEMFIRMRWFFTGVETALWLGGVLCLISELPSSGRPESNLVIAAAIAIAGARVRNPLFGAAAACFVAEYFERVADLGVVAALVIASAAALLLLREWQRPTNEWLFIATLLVLPVAGRSHADEVWTWMTIALYATFGVAMFVLALLRRHHAYFIAGALGIGIASYDYGRLLPFALELRLAIAGALLLGGSFYVARRLRDRTTGFVGTPAKLTSLDDVLESAAAMTAGAAAAKAGAVAPGEARPSGDGRFGGAGASGGY